MRSPTDQTLRLRIKARRIEQTNGTDVPISLPVLCRLDRLIDFAQTEDIEADVLWSGIDGEAFITFYLSPYIIEVIVWTVDDSYDIVVEEEAGLVPVVTGTDVTEQHTCAMIHSWIDTAKHL